ncbi:Hypothetical protein NTJ_10545 [Nesidiocoris tenuis]|uniref:RRM domain-containing protein n=1 Tax=Nesidiocoris tenuis TaxID=355587 RepID=A0ABN7AZY7_9HEMI|nr:Hypothetical protein NTJ_10545 [Nesidiocoris tenuis]
MTKSKKKSRPSPLPWNDELEQLYQRKLQLQRHIRIHRSKRDKSRSEPLVAELRNVLKQLKKANQTSRSAKKRRKQYFDSLALQTEEPLVQESPDSDMASDAGDRYGALGNLNIERLVEFFVCRVEENPQLFPLVKDVLDALRLAHSKIEALELALMEFKDDKKNSGTSGEAIEFTDTALGSLPKKLIDEVSVTGTGSDSDATVLSTKRKKESKAVADISITSDAATSNCNDSLTDATESSVGEGNPRGEGKKRKKRKSAVSPPAEASTPIRTPASFDDRSQIMLNICSEEKVHAQKKLKRASSENPEDFSNISRFSSPPLVQKNLKRSKHPRTDDSVPSKSEDDSIQDRSFASPPIARKKTPKRSRSLSRGIDCAEYELDSSNLELNIQPCFPFPERKPETDQAAESSTKRSNPSLRVIPSVLLLQNPENFEIPDNANRSQEEAPPMSKTEQEVAVRPEDAEEKPDRPPPVDAASLPWKVYFEFDGSVEAVNPVDERIIRRAILDSVGDNVFEIYNIKRYRFTLTGYVNFAAYESASRLAKLGFRLNGKHAQFVRCIQVPPPVRDGPPGNRDPLSSYWNNNNIHQEGRASGPAVSRLAQHRHPTQNRRDGRPGFRGFSRNRGSHRVQNHRGSYKWDRKAPRL